jgi:hypothetical protein
MSEVWLVLDASGEVLGIFSSEESAIRGIWQMNKKHSQLFTQRHEVLTID